MGGSYLEFPYELFLALSNIEQTPQRPICSIERFRVTSYGRADG